MSKKEKKGPHKLAIAGKEVDTTNIASSAKDALNEAKKDKDEERGIKTATVNLDGSTEPQGNAIVHVTKKKSRNRENINAFFKQAAIKKAKANKKEK